MTADTIGGVWTYALELSAALAAFDVEVALATMGRPLNASQRAEAEALRNLQIFESSYKLEWMEDPWADVDAAGDWLRSLESRLEPDIVHLNGYAHGALPWKAPVLVVGHSCVASWWKAVKGGPLPESWITYRNAVRLGLAAADCVVAPSHAMLAALIEHYGLVPNGRVIPNARDPRAFAPVVKEPFILTAGRLWDAAKNISGLESVAMRLPWPVLVAGEEHHPNGRSSANIRTVVPLGYLSSGEMALRLGAASIYALPARYEPFGLSVLEAALSGCALILGDIDSLRENWDGAAVFVDPEDSEALVGAATKLIHQRRRREDLGAAALHRGRSFAPECMGKAYFSLYQQMANDTRPAHQHSSEVQPCDS
ncbi:MAG TPA: glycosyltransferase family 4 protein [Planctomycetota bacterium]|nr:glycosyltransferase family 4 protein [Planctomycetota bacterium]